MRYINPRFTYLLTYLLQHNNAARQQSGENLSEILFFIRPQLLIWGKY